MSSKRIFYIMNGVVALLVIAIIGSTYVATGQFNKQAVKLSEYKLQHQVLEQEQFGLAKAKKDIATYSSLEQIAKSVVPQDKNQAIAVREIVKIAAASGIKPTGINFPSSSLGGPATAAVVPGVPAAPGAASKQALSQLTPVKGIPGVYNLQITIQQEASSPVPYAKFIDFLSRLEQNRRTAHVTGIVLQPSPKDRTMVSFTLTVDEFIKP